MSDTPPKRDWALTGLIGLTMTASLGYFAWLGGAMLGVGNDFDRVNDRLTRIETTMTENKAERERQVMDLDRRVSRIEEIVYRRRNGNGGGE